MYKQVTAFPIDADRREALATVQRELQRSGTTSEIHKARGESFRSFLTIIFHDLKLQNYRPFCWASA